jgi:hypothetical protein
MADTFKYAQLGEFSVAASGVSIGATSVTLNSFKTIEGVNLAMTDFGSIGYGTLSPNTSREEQISFTGVTQNGNGTATLTGVKSVLNVAPYTETSGTTKSQAGNAKFVISNTAGFYNQFTAKGNDETITGLYEFVQNPQKTTAALASNNNDFITKNDLLAAVFGSVNTDQIVFSGTAGETLTAGQVIYFKESDQRFWLADADLVATFDQVVLGFAEDAAVAGGAVNILSTGIEKNLTGLTPGSKYYLSNTAGAISTTPGTTSVFVGIAQTATRFIFDPLGIYMPTANEKAAMAGNNTDIAVGTGNKYVTQTGLQKSSETYAASTTGNDTYVVTLSPVPTSLVNGMTIRFKPDTANTGAATLNVNGLGALAIVTGLSTALVTGDILANQVCEVVYNSTGTVWQLTNPASMVLGGVTYTSGRTTKDAWDTSTTQNIAHGLGKTPKKVKLTFLATFTNAIAPNGSAFLVYNGTTSTCVGYQYITSGGVMANMNDNGKIVIYQSFGGNYYNTGTVTFDATNIIITWVATNPSTASTVFDILWEAEA